MSEWWFWIFVAIPLAGIGLGAIAMIGETVVKLKQLKLGDPDELKHLRKEVQALREEVLQGQKTQKVLALQKQLSDVELKTIEQQTLPEGIAVFLFTDIEGFTRLIDEQGDQVAFHLLQQHNRVLRAAVKAHDGIEIKQLGDGFMFCFSSAKKALLCAAQVQTRLKAAGEDAGVPISVRMGAHAGEPIQSERDFIGQTVNLTERIMGQANGGQIFVSEVVRNLAGPLKGFQYVAQGRRRLEGFSEAQMLYEFQPIEALASPLDSAVDQQLDALEKKLKGRKLTDRL